MIVLVLNAMNVKNVIWTAQKDAITVRSAWSIVENTDL